MLLARKGMLRAHALEILSSRDSVLFYLNTLRDWHQLSKEKIRALPFFFVSVHLGKDVLVGTTH